VPYSQPGANLLDDMIDRINAQQLAFVIHVGDITSGHGPCDDAWMEARKQQFGRFKAPFVLLPGDNEWTDCRRSGFDPMERLPNGASCLFSNGNKTQRKPEILRNAAGARCRVRGCQHPRRQQQPGEPAEYAERARRERLAGRGRTLLPQRNGW
jgi:hypothetical protein